MENSAARAIFGQNSSMPPQGYMEHYGYRAPYFPPPNETAEYLHGPLSYYPAPYDEANNLNMDPMYRSCYPTHPVLARKQTPGSSMKDTEASSLLLNFFNTAKDSEGSGEDGSGYCYSDEPASESNNTTGTSGSEEEDMDTSGVHDKRQKRSASHISTTDESRSSSQGRENRRRHRSSHGVGNSNNGGNNNINGYRQPPMVVGNKDYEYAQMMHYNDMQTDGYHTMISRQMEMQNHKPQAHPLLHQQPMLPPTMALPTYPSNPPTAPYNMSSGAMMGQMMVWDELDNNTGMIMRKMAPYSPVGYMPMLAPPPYGLSVPGQQVNNNRGTNQNVQMFQHELTKKRLNAVNEQNNGKRQRL